ncbi:MAG TPA: transposase [Rhodocyclaceae bacterium]|nr:transposase [Rhodocyclaceae bacterium]
MSGADAGQDHGARDHGRPSRAEELTEEQWAVIEHLFPELQPREEGRGRPPADTRAVLNGVLWIMRTGAPWAVCRNGIRHTKLATDDSKRGCERGRCESYGRR